VNYYLELKIVLGDEEILWCSNLKISSARLLVLKMLKLTLFSIFEKNHRDALTEEFVLNT
jgi:hypothetical protein